MTLQHLQSCLLAVLIAIAHCSAGDVPHASPAGNFSGDLQIPAIARHRELPQRLDLEPGFDVQPTITMTARKYTAFFTRMLDEATETEIQQQAAEFLARLAREDLEPIEPALQSLQRVLQETDNSRVRNACVSAIVAADDRASAPALLSILDSADEATRHVIEIALARWQIAEAAPVWTARLSDRFATTAGFRLATEGLAALDHQSALETLMTFVSDSAVPFSRRMAAARATVHLNDAEARAIASTMMEGSVADRLLCVELLSCDSSDSTQSLALLCEDPTGTVAAAAWHALVQHRPELLVPLLSTGRSHRESGIRMDAAEIMRMFESSERCSWLIQMTGDVHIGVRNSARAALRDVAKRDATLHDEIIKQAEQSLDTDAPWQLLEQSLVLLCELEQAQVAEVCVVLLRHERAEVAVTAAWAMHLFPNAALADLAAVAARDRDEWIGRDGPVPTTLDYTDLSLQVGYLFQMMGLLRDRQLDDLMEKQFSKAVAGTAIKRGAAMWALGLLHEGETDSPLVDKFVARILDTEGLSPEAVEVRQPSILSVGRLNSVDSNRALLKAFGGDSVATRIPQSVRWSMKLMDQRVPALPDPPVRTASGFSLSPMQDEE